MGRRVWVPACAGTTQSELRERGLQIEAGISRLFGLDRAVHAEDLAAEHVVGGAVDGLDADKLALLVAERGKRTLLAIAAYHDLVVSRRKPCDLQLVVALIAPEPRQAVVNLGIAGEPCGHAARLVGGVLHGFQPERTAKARTFEQRAVANRRNIRIGGQ